MSEIDPLVQRIDALLRRHQNDAPEERAPVPGGEEDIPVLTEVVDPSEAVALHPQTGELRSAQLAAQLERAVLQRLLAELDQTLDRRLARSLGELFEQMQHSLRAELAVRMREMVREAVAAAVRRELATHAAPGTPGAEERSA